MNSWFLYEVMVFSMGPFSANIMNHLGKLIMAINYGHVGHGVGEWYNHTVPMNTMGRSSVSIRPSTIGLIVRCGVVCFFFLLA
jgi:hypothetical protein